jgi:predicted site-specific integrase-resolvase
MTELWEPSENYRREQAEREASTLVNFTLERTANELGVNERTVRRWVDRGKLHPMKHASGRLEFDLNEVLDLKFANGRDWNVSPEQSHIADLEEEVKDLKEDMRNLKAQVAQIQQGQPGE